MEITVPSLKRVEQTLVKVGKKFKKTLEESSEETPQELSWNNVNKDLYTGHDENIESLLVFLSKKLGNLNLGSSDLIGELSHLVESLTVVLNRHLKNGSNHSSIVSTRRAHYKKECEFIGRCRKLGEYRDTGGKLLDMTSYYDKRLLEEKAELDLSLGRFETYDYLKELLFIYMRGVTSFAEMANVSLA